MNGEGNLPGEIGGGVLVAACLPWVDVEQVALGPHARDDVDDGPGAQQHHGVALVGAHQQVGVAVVVHVHAAAQGRPQ